MRTQTLRPFNTLSLQRCLRQRHKLPINFAIHNFKPSHACRRAAIGPGHAAGIQEQNAATSFIARDVGMAMHKNLYLIRRMIRCYVLQPEFQSASHKIEHQRPLKIAVTISAHDDHARTIRAKLIQNRFRANIAKMPDFIGTFGHFLHALRQPIVRVGENKDARGFFGCLFRHVVFLASDC